MAHELPPYMFPSTPEDGTEEHKIQRATADKFFLALGKFVSMFAAIEGQLFALLGSMSLVPIEVARALFGDARADTCMSRIKKIVEARRQAGRPIALRVASLLNEVLDHISLINGTRNHILHHMTYFPGNDEPVTSNIARTLTKEAVREMKITPNELDNMFNDLCTAAFIMTVLSVHVQDPDRPVPKELQDLIDGRAWLYKSPLQASAKDRTPRNSPEKQSQP